MEDRRTEPMPLERFIAIARASGTPPSLWEAALRFFHSRAVRMVSYHHYGTSGTDEPLIVADGFPEDWVHHYVEDRLFEVDPIPELAQRSTSPFFWSDTASLMTLVSEQVAYLDELRAAKLGEGLGVPVFGPMSRNGYFGLGFGGVRPAMAPAEVRTLQCAAQLAHLVYCEMAGRQQRQRTGLAPREREVLHWIARGKSNSDIAGIVGISPHTVDTHVRRIFDKLGVSDRTTAAVKGLGSGVLDATGI